MKRRIALSCVGLVRWPCVRTASAAEWVQTWGAAPLPPAPAQGPFPPTASFSNQTVRQTVRVSVGGGRVRLRLSNEYGTKPLVIGAARIALSDDKGNITARQRQSRCCSPAGRARRFRRGAVR